MFNRPLLLSLSTFFILMIFISLIKNNTRNIEKNIEQLNMEISILKKDLLNAEIDFIYLSSPEKLLLLNRCSSNVAPQKLVRVKSVFSNLEFFRFVL